MLKLVLIAFAGIYLAGCKRDRTNVINPPDTSSLQQLSLDDAQVQASDNQISNDANAVLSEGAGKSVDTTISSCSITVDSTNHHDTLVYTLVYSGFNAAQNFSRTGTVVIEKVKGILWSTKGCTVTFTYINLSVTKISSGKTFTFNGSRTWTNASGGLIRDLGNGTTSYVTLQITGNMQITFDNNTTKTWNISRTSTWAGTYPSALTLTVGGNGSADGYNNLIEYGTNRNGEAFYTQINPNTPVLYSESCNWTSIWGKLIHQIPNVPKSATITYGYNNGDVLVTQGTCADNYRLDWNIKGKTGTIYLSIP